MDTLQQYIDTLQELEFVEDVKCIDEDEDEEMFRLRIKPSVSKSDFKQRFSEYNLGVYNGGWHKNEMVHPPIHYYDVWVKLD